MSKDLTNSTHVYVRKDALRLSLQPPYDGPFKVLERTNNYFLIDINGKEKTINIDRLKPCYQEAQEARDNQEHQPHQKSFSEKPSNYFPTKNVTFDENSYENRNLEAKPIQTPPQTNIPHQSTTRSGRSIKVPHSDIGIYIQTFTRSLSRG